VEQEMLMPVTVPIRIGFERRVRFEEAVVSGDQQDSSMDPAPAEAATGPTVGLLFGLDAHGGPLVSLELRPGRTPIPARSIVPLSREDVGREVVLLFEQSDALRPIVMGILRTPRPEPVRTEIDGEKLVFTADREIVLRCGESSITLTRAGKVLIQGAFVMTRSTGTNRIMGAAVEIN